MKIGQIGILALAALVGTTGCDSPEPLAVRAITPTADHLPPDYNVPEGEAAWVCKEVVNLPAGIFNFTSQVTGPLYGGNATYPAWDGTVASGSCRLLQFKGGPPTPATVTENVPVNTRVDSIWVIQRTGGGPLLPTLTVDTTKYYAPINAATGSIGGSGLYGFVMIFFNGPVPQGCTYTLGYWKTHSINGPAPYDDTWNGRETTTFYKSGNSWYNVFWTAPAGNAYYQLAHQYMAAYLNLQNGANAPAAVTTAMASAVTLFNTYTPAQIGALSGSNAVRKQFVNLAGILGAFNEGTTGPGHCGTVDTP